MAYRFDADEGVRDAIVRCAREQLDLAVGELRDGIGDDPVKAIHSARKAIKKERSLLRLARGAMSPKQRRHENDALRQAARRLSGARDADVMIQTTAELSDRFAGQLPQTAFAELADALTRRRDASGGQTPDSAPSERAIQELDAVRLRIDDWQLRQDDWAALESGVLRSYRQGREAFAVARRDPSLENLHTWRKRVKDLWYHQRLLGPVCGPAIRGQAKEAHRLADLLGDDHDLGVLRDALTDDDLAVAADLDAVIALIDHRRNELQTEAIHIGERVYVEKPKAFRRRMRGCWVSGRAVARAPFDHDPAELAQATRAAHAD
jgi:CHAD domain-containing protein